MNQTCLCDLKEGQEKIISQGHWVNLYIAIEEGEYWIRAISDGRADLRIHYCPKCGRKLEEKESLEEYEF